MVCRPRFREKEDQADHKTEWSRRCQTDFGVTARIEVIHRAVEAVWLSTHVEISDSSLLGSRFSLTMRATHFSLERVNH